MHKYGVDYIDLSLTNEDRLNLLELEDDPDHRDVQDRGNCVRIALKKVSKVSAHQNLVLDFHPYRR